MYSTEFSMPMSILSFFECILSILLYWFVAAMNNKRLAKLISNRLIKGDCEDNIEQAKLTEEIEQLQKRMETFSPTVDFARYFRIERSLNRLLDERKKLAESRQTPPTSWKLLLGIRTTLFILGLGLALHSAHQTIVFTINSKYFFPFNFLLSLPMSLIPYYCTYSDDFAQQHPVTLFSLLLLSLIALKLRDNIRKESSKKLQ